MQTIKLWFQYKHITSICITPPSHLCNSITKGSNTPFIITYCSITIMHYDSHYNGSSIDYLDILYTHLTLLYTVYSIYIIHHPRMRYRRLSDQLRCIVVLLLKKKSSSKSFGMLPFLSSQLLFIFTTRKLTPLIYT